MLDIFLTGPHDLHWALDVLCNFDSANDAINVQATTEASSYQMIVHYDFIQR